MVSVALPIESYISSQNSSAITSNIPISVPGYSRSSQECGIVHFGVGGFHRSHLAFYMDVLANDFNETQWSICGVGIREDEKRFAGIIKEQDGLFTLVTKCAAAGKDNDACVSARIIGSLNKYIHVQDEQGATKIINQLASETTKIVSLTITESGYNIGNTGEFNLFNQDVQHDLDAGNNNSSEPPRTVFGFIVQAMNIRRKLGRSGFTILSCDNLVSNGDTIKKCILSFINALGNKPLLEWVLAGNVCFPNSMVDRITPVTNIDDVKYVHNVIGIKDNSPVVCEEYTQWILEDSFCDNARPPLELLSGSSYNVLLTSNVEPYELLKLRLLNSTHTAICYLGALSGFQFIHEIFQNAVFVKYVMNMMVNEVIPTLPLVEGINLQDYAKSIVKRFSNGNIADRCSRICNDGATKMVRFLLPIVKDQITSSRPIAHLTLAVASWIVFLYLNDDSTTPLVDVLVSELQLQRKIRQAFCEKTKHLSVTSILAIKQVFGDLGENNVFCKGVQQGVDQLLTYGANSALKDFAFSTSV